MKRSTRSKNKEVERSEKFSRIKTGMSRKDVYIIGFT